MPKKKVKKKGVKGKKKASSKTKSAAAPDLTPEGQKKRAELELQIVKNELADARDEQHFVSAKAAGLQQQVQAQLRAIEERERDAADVAGDLTRQYRRLESNLMAKILDLQEANRRLETELASTKLAMSESLSHRDKVIQDKDDLIKQLQQRIGSLETSYESVLNNALEAMASKVEAARDKWEVESYVVQQRNKDILMDFGLSHVAL